MSSSLAMHWVIALYGVSEGKLLLYEEEGLIKPEKSTDGRFYSAKDCGRIQLILRSAELGFSISELKVILKGTSRYDSV
jgi:DNA-binding transcriptional MerR regulator